MIILIIRRVAGKSGRTESPYERVTISLHRFVPIIKGAIDNPVREIVATAHHLRCGDAGGTQLVKSGGCQCP